ncbi:uncharacterized protein LOC110940680 isoform X2 [Helianthus annuus]|uniref:uncharacterized protein LOC110940680 isoform X2 n=1 Tax=Helianthus annuus TaxID=4232 RepID=UPI0016533FB5|nr:uncharacterized protein LOC110940680 isoform X2 [Helianthus annuus]
MTCIQVLQLQSTLYDAGQPLSDFKPASSSSFGGKIHERNCKEVWTMVEANNSCNTWSSIGTLQLFPCFLILEPDISYNTLNYLGINSWIIRCGNMVVL